ncbi:hypothetical protein GJAV_G00085640 [Gymnothorax javanicus]|nr:hypothetical protein GJAV_G00085640 [Gymnothorax javanicus]
MTQKALPAEITRSNSGGGSKFQQRIQEREKELQDLETGCAVTYVGTDQREKHNSWLLKSHFRRSQGSLQSVVVRSPVDNTLSSPVGPNPTESHTVGNRLWVPISQSLCAPPKPGDLPSITVRPHNSFEAVRKSVFELKEQLGHVFKLEFIKVFEKVGKVKVLGPMQDPKTREDFLQYSSEITLDPNTANEHLRLSEGNRESTRVAQIQSYTDHPERFNYWWQVLCREGLSGRCYWEAEWGGDGVSIGASYKEISRKGEGYDCCLENNNKSWALRCSPSSYSFWHNNKETKIPVPSFSRIGVYLDHRAGTLSFYSVSNTMTLLHRVQTTFTQPLYPGFWLCYNNCSVKLCPLK